MAISASMLALATFSLLSLVITTSEAHQLDPGTGGDHETLSVWWQVTYNAVRDVDSSENAIPVWRHWNDAAKVAVMRDGAAARGKAVPIRGQVIISDLAGNAEVNAKEKAANKGAAAKSDSLRVGRQLMHESVPKQYHVNNDAAKGTPRKEVIDGKNDTAPVQRHNADNTTRDATAPAAEVVVEDAAATEGNAVPVWRHVMYDRVVTGVTAKNKNTNVDAGAKDVDLPVRQQAMKDLVTTQPHAKDDAVPLWRHVMYDATKDVVAAEVTTCNDEYMKANAGNHVETTKSDTGALWRHMMYDIANTAPGKGFAATTWHPHVMYEVGKISYHKMYHNANGEAVSHHPRSARRFLRSS